MLQLWLLPSLQLVLLLLLLPVLLLVLLVMRPSQQLGQAAPIPWDQHQLQHEDWTRQWASIQKLLRQEDLSAQAPSALLLLLLARLQLLQDTLCCSLLLLLPLPLLHFLPPLLPLLLWLGLLLLSEPASAS